MKKMHDKFRLLNTMRLWRYNREDINSQHSALKTKRKINYVKGYFTSESGKIILDSNIILSKIF